MFPLLADNFGYIPRTVVLNMELISTVRNSKFTSLLAFSVCLLHLSFFSAKAKGEGLPWVFMGGVETWISSGSASFVTSFRDIDPQIGPLEGSSELEWEDLDSLIFMAHGEFGVKDRLTFRGRVGLGDIEDGTNTDTDRLSIPAAGLNDRIVSRSISDTEGDVELFDADAVLHLSPIRKKNYTLLFNVSLGYLYYTDGLEDRRGIQTVVLDRPVYEPFDEQGLNATYDMEWTGWRAGLEGRWRSKRSPLRVFAIIDYLFALDYEGVGNWPLRNEFRAGGPSFIHEADGGDGFQFEIKAEYGISEYVDLYLGYRIFHMELSDGTGTTFLADGDTLRTHIDSFESERSGIYLGAEVTF